MKFSHLIFPALLMCSPIAAWAAPASFTQADGRFVLDGEPFTIKAAELHYPRIPRPYWDQRIKMSKALGMNTICLYVFWNAHEPEEGVFDFSGQNDLREFIKLCADNDMKVILRPGPYVCAEWEMGGLPWWLLKNKDICLRENDPEFLKKVERFEHAVADQVRDLTAPEGGPVIMIQVENEYGSYGTDKPYVSAIRDMLRKEYGDDVTMFQCDWNSNFQNNGLDDLVWTMNFGTGADIDEQFRALKEVRPDSPLMCSEFWSGWFDKWGANHETRSAEAMIEGIDEMLSKDISFSLYMTHGGTNWGHWAGANSPGYAPDVTSYDYDAPIDESGRPTEKYHLLRSVMQKYNGCRPLPEIPDTFRVAPVAEFTLDAVAPLFYNLPEAIFTDTVTNMEALDQGFGSLLYSTILPEGVNGEGLLTVNDLHDFGQVFLNDRFIGTIDRRKNEKAIRLPELKPGDKLEILVEAMGRINFGRAIKDFKGITENVKLKLSSSKSLDLKGWSVAKLPDTPEFYEAQRFFPTGSFTPGEDGRLPRGVYSGTFNIDTPADTYLDFSDWGKGLVYVNGYGIGRIWEIGPQQTLYMPGCWLKEGENEIMVFDILGPRSTSVRGLDHPVVDQVMSHPLAGISGEAATYDASSKGTLLFDSELREGNGWQTVEFNPTAGRYLKLDIQSTFDGTLPAIAELYLLDDGGNRIPRDAWSVAYVGSEDIAGGNHSGDKAFDLQESTYWTPAPGAEMPQTLVIDLGREYITRGMEILPRMEKGAPGAVKNLTVTLQ